MQVNGVQGNAVTRMENTQNRIANSTPLTYTPLTSLITNSVAEICFTLKKNVKRNVFSPQQFHSPLRPTSLPQKFAGNACDSGIFVATSTCLNSASDSSTRGVGTFSGFLAVDLTGFALPPDNVFNPFPFFDTDTLEFGCCAAASGVFDFDCAATGVFNAGSVAELVTGVDEVDTVEIEIVELAADCFVAGSEVPLET